MKVYTGPAGLIHFAQDVFAFDQNWGAAFPSKAKIGLALPIDSMALGDTGDLPKRILQMLLGYPTANGHLESTRAFNQIEECFRR